METKRRRYIIANKYQTAILIPVFLATIILMLLVIVLFAILMFVVLSHLTSSPVEVTLRHLQIGGLIAFGILLVCNSVLLMWAYRVTHRLAGPLERISRELDEMVEGKRDIKSIILRKGDYLVEIVEKLNKLLERTK